MATVARCWDRSEAHREMALLAKKGATWPPFGLGLLNYLILPAIFAATLAALLERDQTLAAHRERRIEERLLVELRKSGLGTIQRQTRSPLFQHVRDRSLN